MMMSIIDLVRYDTAKAELVFSLQTEETTEKYYCGPNGHWFVYAQEPSEDESEILPLDEEDVLAIMESAGLFSLMEVYFKKRIVDA